MLKKILLFFLIFTSQNLTAYEITLDDLRILLGNWTKLVPVGAYDFVPEEVTYEIYSDKKLFKRLKKSRHPGAQEAQGPKGGPQPKKIVFYTKKQYFPRKNMFFP